jgi:hypothetical protein
MVKRTLGNVVKAKKNSLEMTKAPKKTSWILKILMFYEVKIKLKSHTLKLSKCENDFMDNSYCNELTLFNNFFKNNLFK